MSDPIEIFFSYAHEDEDLMDDVRRQLIVYERNGQILKWHDRMISAGGDWKSEIDHRLTNARIVLLFMSPHFIESRYCYEIEGETALQRHKSGDSIVIPIVLRPCPWEETPFGQIQLLPEDGKPITSWDDRDEACLLVARGVMAVVDTLAPKHGVEPSLTPSESHEIAVQDNSQITIYCARCGATTGSVSRCPGHTQHSFVKASVDVFCSRCGGSIGQPSKCPGFIQHNFVAKESEVHCNRCGVTPGVSTRCPGHTQHNFDIV